MLTIKKKCLDFYPLFCYNSRHFSEVVTRITLPSLTTVTQKTLQ